MDKEKAAIERLKMGAEAAETYYNAPLIICYSGGKDSDVLLQLALNSGISFEVLHTHTTADAPETVYHISHVFRKLEGRGIKCTREYPVYKGKPTSMWSLIPIKKIPPTRLMRYCCDILKEQGGKNRAIATGVRWDESRARTKRGIYESSAHKAESRIIINNDNDEKRRWFERCEMQAKTVVNPIIDWADTDVWDYIADNKIECNPLYCEGFKRVGCVGCPLANKHNRQMEFQRYPKFEQMYIHSFDRMLKIREAEGKDTRTWKSGYDVFRWWTGESEEVVK